MSIVDEGAQVARSRIQVPNYFPDAHAREHDDILEQLFGREEDTEDGFIREKVRQYISFMKTKKALDQERADVSCKLAEINQKAKELNEARKEIPGLERFTEERDGRQNSLPQLGSEEL
ncbi:hypothetical protein CBER1_02476 [Cercospora berteroae]|uniref:Uncharacterized protein n=1 Tax=Cercospora berteroae TaxID=357750 RepID=A0A2S6C439_9PEZI|nr:hypothetical protein CBER1_02476 [Cercospora berteroae]